MFFTLKYFMVGSRLSPSIFHSHSFCTELTHRFRSLTHQNPHHLLERCSSMRELKLLHAQIILHGLSHETLTLGKLISFCAVADTGSLDYARLVFEQMPHPNKFMYNSLIRGYSNVGDSMSAIFLYRKMIRSGLSPNEFTIPFVLKACTLRSAHWEAVVVHGHTIKLGIGSQVCVQNVLISVYFVYGSVPCAWKVFDEILERTLVSWNSMIGGYSKMGCREEAFLLFQEMRQSGMEPDEFTLVSLLSVCSRGCDLNLGRYLHLYIVITGVNVDLIVRNALVDMYAKCGHLHSAEMVFNQMPDKNVVSWTSMVTAYARLGLTQSAQEIFDKMPVKNVVSWNSMISSYVQEGRCMQALDLFHKMCDLRVVPDEATLVSVFSACTQIGDLIMGKKIHNYLCSHNLMPSVTIYNSLVDMYAKCGALRIAVDIFHEIPEKNLVSWNVIIGALALYGCGLEAIDLFERMQAGGIRPDEITFTGLLSACGHSGLVDLGRYYFDKMSSNFGISPEIEHYACMVDLLGRAGRLKEAKNLIEGMPLKPNVGIWQTLISACRVHGDLEMGREVGEILLRLDGENPVNYVMMSNIFAEAGYWKDSERIRKTVKIKGLKKEAGRSWVEIDKEVHFFYNGDDTHPLTEKIHEVLKEMEKRIKEEVGYVHRVRFALHDVEEESKEESLRVHSEKLAIGLALLCNRLESGERRVIRIFKNLRVCGDCHAFIKGLSKVLKVVFIVRDANRFHKFEHGLCSCGDYW